MNIGKTYFIFILILLINSSLFAIEPTIDTVRINQIITFNNDRLELLKKIIHSVKLQNLEIEEITLTNFTDFEFEGIIMGDNISAWSVMTVSFTKKNQISFTYTYGSINAYIYKDDEQRQKLEDLIYSSYHEPIINYKYFLVCSNLMEKNDTIRQEIGKNLLKELSCKDSLPGLFTDFFDIPDFINTTNLNSYKENSANIDFSYKKHRTVLAQSKYAEEISIYFHNLQITENILKRAYISKFHNEFLQVIDPSQSNLDFREFNILNYSGCFKEVKETNTTLGDKSYTSISFPHYVYFVFNDYVIYLELPETKSQIISEDLNNWKNQIEIVIEYLNPWIKNLENNKKCN